MVSEMDDDGEPISVGRRDARAAETGALRDVLSVVALFIGGVRVNGILALLLIGPMQTIGWWEPAGAVATEDIAIALIGRLRTPAAPAM